MIEVVVTTEAITCAKLQKKIPLQYATAIFPDFVTSGGPPTDLDKPEKWPLTVVCFITVGMLFYCVS